MKHPNPSGSRVFAPPKGDKRPVNLFATQDRETGKQTILVGRYPPICCGNPRPIPPAEVIDVRSFPRVVVSLPDPYLPAA